MKILNEEECGLLFRAIPNEVVNGFKIRDFAGRIGVPEEQYEAMIQVLQKRKPSSIYLSEQETATLRNALSTVVLELGEEEFWTRTGYDLHFARSLLRRLDQDQRPHSYEPRAPY